MYSNSAARLLHYVDESQHNLVAGRGAVDEEQVMVVEAGLGEAGKLKNCFILKIFNWGFLNIFQ